MSNFKNEEEKKIKEEEPKVVESNEILEDEEKASEETVTITKAKLDKLMERLERVESTADKGRLDKYDSARKGELSKYVKLRTLGGKVITNIETIDNTVEKNPNTGIYTESQLIELTFENGRKQKIPYIQYARQYEYLRAEVKGETVDTKTGKTIFSVETNDGKTYEIREEFIN